MSTQDALLHAIPEGLPSPSDHEGFQKLFTQKRGIFIKMSTPYLKTSRLDESDILSTAWLCYRTAIEKYDPSRGTTLVTHWVNLYRIYLYENYGPQTVCLAPEPRPDDSDSTDSFLDDGYRSDNLMMDASGFAVHDFTGGESDWTMPSVSDHAAEFTADDEHHTMLDFMVAHPAWFHARYRSIILSISKNGSISGAALDIERSESRARQLERYLRSILHTPHLVRDSRIPLEDPVPDTAGFSLRYTPLQKIQCHDLPPQRNRPYKQIMQQIQAAQRMVCPIIIDQHGRVLDGLLRYHVATHYGMATVPTILHPIKGSESSDLFDLSFTASRKLLSGQDSPTAPKQKYASNGSLFSF